MSQPSGCPHLPPPPERRRDLWGPGDDAVGRVRSGVTAAGAAAWTAAGAAAAAGAGAADVAAAAAAAAAVATASAYAATGAARIHPEVPATAAGMQSAAAGIYSEAAGLTAPDSLTTRATPLAQAE